MSMWLEILFKIEIAVMVFCIISAYRSEKKMSRTWFQLLTSALMAVGANYAVLLSPSKLFSMWAYVVYYVSTDWLIFYLLLFVSKYCNKDFVKYPRENIIRGVILVDTIGLMLNVPFHFMFDLEKMQNIYGATRYVVQFQPVMYVHYAFAYVLAANALVVLFRRAKATKNLNREKYGGLFVIITLIFASNIIINLRAFAIDVSVFFYGFGAIFVYYGVMRLIPLRLLNQGLKYVSLDMKDYLLVFDPENECVHANRSAKSFFHLNAENCLTTENAMFDWILENNLTATEDFTKNKQFTCYGKEYHVEIQYHRLVDKKNRFQGGVYIIEDRTEEVMASVKQRFLATHDNLTGVYNKEYFFVKASQLLMDNPQEEYVVVCSDISNFKLVNDIFGMEEGNNLLVRIGNSLKEQTIEGEVYGRIGSDRFALVMPKYRFRKEIFVSGPKSVSHIEEDDTYPVRIYVGVYEVTDRSMPISAMCDRAQMALETIKGDYEKRVAFYDEELRSSVLREQELTSEVSEAIAKEHLQIYLQPQLDRQGNVLGSEALIRWVHPIKGMMLPGEFIPVFEKNGTIAKVDRHVWELACKQLRRWKDMGREDMYISINISPKDFYFMDIYNVFTELVKRYDINPKNLKLEITETAIMMNFQRQLTLINKLREDGFIVEMDDFGSGYSSLNMLKDIKVDVLKLDMAFLRKSEDEERGRKILRMIIELSKQLEMPVITEGVETAEQVRFLTEMGCDIFQGYYFAKPMDIGTFEEQYMQE